LIEYKHLQNKKPAALTTDGFTNLISFSNARYWEAAALTFALFQRIVELLPPANHSYKKFPGQIVPSFHYIKTIVLLYNQSHSIIQNDDK
jgi:hypothetical protein